MPITRNCSFFLQFLLFLSLLIFGFKPVLAQQTIDYLSYDWKNSVYSNAINLKSSTNHVNFSIADFDPNTSLAFSSRSNFSIFINSQFYKHASNSDTIIISANSIGKPKLITIFSNSSIESVSILNGNLSSQKLKYQLYEPPKISFLDLKRAAFQTKTRFLIGVIVLLLILVAIRISITSFSSYFTGIFQLGDFSTRGALLRKDGILVVFFSILLIITLLCIFTPFKSIFDIKSTLEIAYVSKSILYLTVISTTNMVMQNIISPAFNLSKLAKIYAVELIFIIMVIVIFLVPFYVFVFNPYYKIVNFQGINLINIISPIYLLILINEIYFFYGRHRVRKIYIIAYICICDLMPFLISLKFLTELQYI